MDPAQIDWDRVQVGTYVVHQRFRYEYPSPIRDLEHQLVVIPAPAFGDQSRVLYSVEVSEPGEVITRIDSFSNTVLDVHIPIVEQVIVFDTWVSLERHAPLGPRSLPGDWLRDPRFVDETFRTRPDSAIEEAAAQLLASGARGLDLAQLACSWVYETMTYTPGATGIHTTAAAALADRRGVCQDYSHVMIALCRAMQLPTLYVSGHLLGEGGTHSWVEVLLPARDDSSKAEGWSLDPTHDRQADLTYLTVAVGRDYGDVAPTSGSYRARHGGTLVAHKDVRVVDIAYAPTAVGSDA
jgi:transglutaminase-like putative cysteine protease